MYVRKRVGYARGTSRRVGYRKPYGRARVSKVRYRKPMYRKRYTGNKRKYIKPKKYTYVYRRR